MRFAGVMKERGSALAAALIVTAALLFLGGALLSLAVNEQKIFAHQERELTLYYLTEAGVEAGLAALGADYFFQGPLCGLLGRGSYTVEINPLPDNRRLVTSTGRLQQKSLKLSVIAGLNPLYEQALLVSDHLEIENVDIFGNLHVNRDLQVKGPNRVIATAAAAGLFSYSKDPPQFIGPSGSLLVGDRLYTSTAGFGGGGQAMKADPIAWPALNFEALERKIQCFLDPPPSTITLTATPACYPQQNRIQVNGNLLIAPGEGREFDFDGLLVVKGDLEIHQRKGGAVNFNGCLVVEGDATVKGEINRDSRDFAVLLAAGGDILLRDMEAPLLFGGTVLLFSGEEIKIGPCELDTLHIRGALIAKKLALEKCCLYYAPEAPATLKDLLSDRGVIIREWIKP